MMTFMIIIIIAWIIGELINKSMGVENKEPEIIQNSKIPDTNTNVTEEEEERLNYLKSITSFNPIKWAKYASIISRAETKFIDLYNFNIPNKFKTLKYITNLANTCLFEEIRKSKLSNNEFLELMAGMRNKGEFNSLIKPVDNNFFDFKNYGLIYTSYIEFRARRIKPYLAMIISVLNIDKEITEAEITEIIQELENDEEIKNIFLNI